MLIRRLTEEYGELAGMHLATLNATRALPAVMHQNIFRASRG